LLKSKQTGRDRIVVSSGGAPEAAPEAQLEVAAGS